jgi:hypothetical protein
MGTACAPPMPVSPPAPVVPAAARPPDVMAAQGRRMPMTLAVPLGAGSFATPRAGEPAPVPNRDLEAPPDRITDPMAPRVEPMVLGPDRRQGMTFGGEHLRDTGERSLDMSGVRLPLDNILPGARVRIPFE